MLPKKELLALVFIGFQMKNDLKPFRFKRKQLFFM